MIRLLFLILIPVTFSLSANFFILEDASQVRILNKYEQDARDTFALGTPFQVIDQNFLLSDGITPAWKTRLRDKTFFLIPGNDAPKLYTDCSVLQDTVQFIYKQLTINLIDGSKQVLHKGQFLERIFQKGSQTYVLTEQFAWCRLPRRSWKKVQAKETPKAGLPKILEQRINNRLESINQTYRQFYHFFNTKYQKTEPIPQWIFVPEENKYRIHLNHAQIGVHLASSIRTMQQDLGQLLYGSGFHYQFNNNQFIISAVPTQ